MDRPQAENASTIKVMGFVEPQHSKNQVNRAGRVVGSNNPDPDELDDAKKIIAEFRSAHAYPLASITMHVRNKTKTVSADAIVAQRMKRLPTILDKLKRFPKMSVARMQDFGGCRVILENIQQVRDLETALRRAVKAKNQISGAKNHIDEPTATGYRSSHLIFDYQASKEAYRGLKIELQIRTALQHSWATAIETIDLFSKSELKYGQGEPELRRFFALVGSLMAHREGTGPVPGAEGSPDELIEELSEIEERLGILDRLESYSAVANDLGNLPSSANRYITLELHRNARRLEVGIHDDTESAQHYLAQRESLEDSDIDVVLIKLEKISQLNAAYPNYFADTSKFVHFVRESITQG